MYIKSLELENYRNYKSLNLSFDKGTTILYGDNAQGKTNILEAIYVSATTKSHKGSKDREIINFEEEEGHIRTILEKDGLDYRIDMHLRKAKSKGIAINCEKIKKASELIGLLNVVFFSPEDLNIIKDGPAYRRRFVDMELCQLDQFYIYNLNNYNKIVNQRNKLLKDLYFNPSLRETLMIWDTQLESFGSKIIERRAQFCEQLNEIIYDIHQKLSGGKEEIKIVYEPNVSASDIGIMLQREQERDIKTKMTSVGPHRDDFAFMVNGIDIRKFGSQGQQRTAALSLKLAEIELVKKITKELQIRKSDDFTPLSEDIIPSEIIPLVSAVNSLFERIDEMIKLERSFISDAAHELRSPLTALKVHLEVAELSLDDKTSIANSLSNLKIGVERGSRLVEQLLALSKLDNNIQDKANDIIDWKVIISAIIDEQSSIIENKKLNVEYQIAGKSFLQYGNAFLCSLMLRNLIDNATRYSDVQADIKINVTEDYLTVTNNKTDVDKQHIMRLGERFFRPSGQKENGSGLGLSIVKKIASIHNCRFECSSDKDRFIVKIYPN